MFLVPFLGFSLILAMPVLGQLELRANGVMQLGFLALLLSLIVNSNWYGVSSLLSETKLLRILCVGFGLVLTEFVGGMLLDEEECGNGLSVESLE